MDDCLKPHQIHGTIFFGLSQDFAVDYEAYWFYFSYLRAIVHSSPSVIKRQFDFVTFL